MTIHIKSKYKNYQGIKSILIFNKDYDWILILKFEENSNF